MSREVLKPAPKYEEQIQEPPPKNVGCHGWPERSAHGRACSGFWEGVPESDPCTDMESTHLLEHRLWTQTP